LLQPFYLTVRCRKSNSTWRFSWWQMISLCVKVDTIECLLAGRWCGLAFKYRWVWVALLKAVWAKEPSGPWWKAVELIQQAVEFSRLLGPGNERVVNVPEPAAGACRLLRWVLPAHSLLWQSPVTATGPLPLRPFVRRTGCWNSTNEEVRTWLTSLILSSWKYRLCRRRV
jgi:hypothetical protein